MRCKFCGADMRAVTYNSDGYSERLVVLDDFNKINEDSPPLQVEGGIAKNKHSGSGGHISPTDMRQDYPASDKRQQCCRVIMNDIWVHNVD